MIAIQMEQIPLINDLDLGNLVIWYEVPDGPWLD
jgi:hypothetical protein